MNACKGHKTYKCTKSQHETHYFQYAMDPSFPKQKFISQYFHMV